MKIIPPELLSCIFKIGYDKACRQLDAKEHRDTSVAQMRKEFGIGDEGHEEGDNNAADCHPSSFPIVASHVCRRWRDVALSTPSLWTNIIVPTLARPPYELASTLLERSKAHPIDIRVECHPFLHDTYDHEEAIWNTTLLFSMLIRHIHRWRSMKFAATDYDHIHCFLKVVSDPSITAAPLLATLELNFEEHFDGYWAQSMLPNFILFGGSAPMLTRLVLQDAPVDWSQPWIASASNLTHLELVYYEEIIRPSRAQLATILRSASSLQSLTLDPPDAIGGPEESIEESSGSPAYLNDPVQLPQVTDVVLTYESQAHAIGLLRKLCLPALKHLVLYLKDGNHTELVDELAGPATSLPLSSAAQEQPCSLLCRLASLKLGRLPSSAGDIEKLCSQLYNLESLSLPLWDRRLLFLDILGMRCTSTMGRGDVWLPRLEKLHVSGVFDNGDIVRQVVRERRDAGAPLSALYMDNLNRLNDEDVAWFKANVKTFKVLKATT